MYILYVIVLLLASKCSFAERVNCGAHWANSCSDCPKDSRGISHGSFWCNGVCKWDGDVCVSRTMLDVSQFNKGCGTTVGYTNVETDFIIGGHRTKSHRFPWMVRIYGGCAGTVCGGTLITSKHVVTAFHCTCNNFDRSKPCDHSDGKRVAILGADEISYYNNIFQIPIIDVKYPKGAPINNYDRSSHDFAISILQYHATFSETVRPICLPMQGTEYSGQLAVAAGWGRYANPNVSVKQSKYLRDVTLRVSGTKYPNYKMFGTKLYNQHGKLVDACSGDSGGPLMIQDPATRKYILIGTVTGSGYDCRTGSKVSSEGVWNKVSAHTNWILELVGW